MLGNIDAFKIIFFYFKSIKDVFKILNNVQTQQQTNGIDKTKAANDLPNSIKLPTKPNKNDKPVKSSKNCC